MDPWIVMTSVLLFTVCILILIYFLTPCRSALDLLNHRIKATCEFKSVYAGGKGLPTTREYIKELGELEDSWEEIRDEMLNATEDKEIPSMHDAYNNMFLYKGSGKNKNPLVNVFTWIVMKIIYGGDTEIFDQIGTDKWRTYNLVLFNQNVPGNAEKCPRTIQLLKKIPGMQSALFSFMKPGAYVPPHNDPAKGVIRYHLALKVPEKREKCFLEVDGYKHHWKEGEGFIFDDIYDHTVRNDTNETRVILFVDILRPLEGTARALQSLANFLNYYNPGVRRLINESREKKISEESEMKEDVVNNELIETF